MPTGLIKWGAASSATTPHYENELLLGYTPFDWLTDRPPREGSEFVQARSGIEDAWITGRDYTFDAEFRFIPDKPSTSPDRSVVAGPVSWQAFLDYAREKNPFRFVPNANTPDFYVESCYLVEPLRGFGSNLADLTRGVRLVLRSTHMDFTQAMRGVVFEYKPGVQMRDLSTGAAFARGSAGAFLQGPSCNSHGQLVGSAASGTIRDRHRATSTERALLLEPASTNLILQSEAQGTTMYTAAGISVTSNDRKAPDASRSTTADKLIASTSVGGHSIVQTVSIVADTTCSLVMHIRAAEMARLRMFADNAGADWFGATVNLDASSAASYSGGNGAVTWGPVIRALDESWWELRVAGSINSTSTSARMVLAIDSTSGAASFAGATSGQGLHTWGWQLENRPTPTAYMASATGVGTRSGETLTVDWLWKPQGGWMYAKFEERGYAGSSERVFSIANSAEAQPYLLVRRLASYSVSFGDHVTSVDATLSSAPAVTDTVELLVTLSTAGLASLRQALNAGTETSVTAGVAPTMPSSWSAATLALNATPGGANVGTLTLLHFKAGFSTGITTIALARSA